MAPTAMAGAEGPALQAASVLVRLVVPDLSCL